MELFMATNSVDDKVSNYQLISVGIELAYSVLTLSECLPEINKSSHFNKAYTAATKWNKIFFELFVTSRGGDKC